MQLIGSGYKTKLEKPKPKPAPASAYVKVEEKQQKEKKPKLTRMDKAFTLADKVLKHTDGSFFVPSQTDASKVYQVFNYGRGKMTCDCPDFGCRDVTACKHILATKMFMRLQEEDDEEKAMNQKGKAITTAESTSRQQLEDEYTAEASDIGVTWT